jgi:hypothetical protein
MHANSGRQRASSKKSNSLIFNNCKSVFDIDNERIFEDDYDFIDGGGERSERKRASEVYASIKAIIDFHHLPRSLSILSIFNTS